MEDFAASSLRVKMTHCMAFKPHFDGQKVRVCIEDQSVRFMD